MTTIARQYSNNGLSKFVLRHNLTGEYFINSRGFSATIANATRIIESEMTVLEIVIRHTWGDNFTAVQIGN